MFTGTLDTVHLFGNTVSVLVWTQLVFHFMEMRKRREISCLILFPPPHAEDIVQQDYCYFWHRIWVWHDPNREICGVIWLMAWHGNTVLCNWFSSVWNGVLFFFIIICSVYRACIVCSEYHDHHVCTKCLVYTLDWTFYGFHCYK